VFFVGTITALRLFYLTTAGHDLFFDEAQYWHWSLDPSWGYYSKPPMVAWFISLTTGFCGQEEWCVRLSSPLLHAATSLVIFAMGSFLGDRKIGFYSALAYITLPAVTVSSFLVSTDPSLLFFWACAMYSFLRAAESHSWGWWVLAGLFAGLGMLSKYNMLVFLFSAILFLNASTIHKDFLKSRKFWISTIIAFAIFLPNIIWNARHKFVSFLHTRDNANIQKDIVNFDHMFEFLGAQFVVFGPIFFAILLWLIWKTPQLLKRFPYNFSIAFVVPMLGLITLVSFLSRAHANWAAPVYVAGTILVVQWCIENQRKNIIYISLLLHTLLIAGLFHFPTVTSTLGITLTGSTNSFAERQVKDPFKRLYGWSELGESIGKLLPHYPNTSLLTAERKIHAELLYYVRPHPFYMIKWNPDGSIGDHYDLTTDIEQSFTKDFLLVTQQRHIDHISAYFENMERVGHITLTPYEDDLSRDVYLFHLTGFKGYEKTIH
jgi:4-amino-4-deoxy-L-arabinose transferase-like glycosyltransferase